MFTTGSKWFFGVAGAALVAALVYGGATNPSEVGMSTFTGVLTLGYKGGVGDHLGYAILMGICGAALFLGAVSAAFRDADVSAEADSLGGPVPEVVAPDRGSYWPVIGAFGAGLVVLGVITNAVIAGFGLVIVVAATFEWAISAWADLATTDPDVNRAVRRRVMMPIEVPVLGALGVGVFVFAMSRVLLAIDKTAVYFFFGGIALAVLVITSVLALRPKINPNVIAGIAVLGALVVIGGGVASAIVGPRNIEPHHSEDHGDAETEEHEGAPRTVIGSYPSGEAINRWTHGMAFVLSIPAALFLWNAADHSNLASAIAYGISCTALVALYAASTLSHSFEDRPELRQWFRVADQVCIYCMIAGTFTPFAAIHLQNVTGMLQLAAIWTLACIGIAIRVRQRGGFIGLSDVALCLATGWIPIFSIVELYAVGGTTGLGLVFLGGVFFTGGIYFLLNDNRHPYWHGIWHLAAIGGTACHYLFILDFVGTR